MDRLQTFLLLCGGGALGAAARYLVGGWLTRPGERFPWGTLTVNLLGCLALGFVLTILHGRLPAARAWHTLAAVGFLGAFTTFSTFAWEVHVLIRSDAWLRASAYVLVSVGLGLAALRLGIALAHRLPGG